MILKALLKTVAGSESQKLGHSLVAVFAAQGKCLELLYRAIDTEVEKTCISYVT